MVNLSRELELNRKLSPDPLIIHPSFTVLVHSGPIVRAAILGFRALGFPRGNRIYSSIPGNATRAEFVGGIACVRSVSRPLFCHRRRT
jgi:hypothetical protein